MMLDSPKYLADYLMTRLRDATADSTDDTFKEALVELKRLCDQELEWIAEHVADRT